jgi:hypothetical protein
MHHVKYDNFNPLRHRIELCPPCHGKARLEEKDKRLSNPVPDPRVYDCKRCEYWWVGRNRRNPKRAPAVCPYCDSALWNMPKE